MKKQTILVIIFAISIAVVVLGATLISIISFYPTLLDYNIPDYYIPIPTQNLCFFICAPLVILGIIGIAISTHLLAKTQTDKQQRRIGINAIIFGTVFLILLLLIPYLYHVIPWKSKYGYGEALQSISAAPLNAIGILGVLFLGANDVQFIIAVIMTFVTIISSITLVIVGILCLYGKKSQLSPQKTILIASIAIIITGAFALIFSLTYSSFHSPSIGSLFLIIAGVVGLIKTLASHKQRRSSK